MSRVATLSSSTCDAVDQAEVDDVDAELGVDDVAHRLLDVLDLAGSVALARWRSRSRSCRLAQSSSRVRPRLRGRVLPGHPAQQRALDPCRVLATRRRTRRRPRGRPRRARPRPWRLHQREERVVHGAGPRRRSPMTRSVITEVDGLADRAAHRRRRRRRRHEPSPSTLHPQGDLVAARRVDVVHLGVERLPQALVVRVAVVVQDDLLVQRLELHASPPAEELLHLLERRRPARRSRPWSL